MSFTRRAAILAFAATTALTAIIPGVASAADPVKLEVGYIPILAASPLFLIDGEGWAKDAGIELKLTRFESGPHGIQALAGGKLDLLYAGVAPVLVAHSKGSAVSVIANSAVEEMVVGGRGDFAKAVGGKVTAESLAKFAADNGRKVKFGTQPIGSVPNTVLQYWLFKVLGANPEHVELVPMGIEKTQQALLAGGIDAATIREPTVQIILELDPSVQLLATGGEMFPNQPGTVIAARDEVLDKNAAAIDKLVKANIRAIEQIKADPARAAKVANEYLGKGLVAPEVLEKAYASPGSKFLADPHQVVDAVQAMMSYSKEIGAAENVPDVKKAFDFRFYDAAVKK